MRGIDVGRASRTRRALRLVCTGPVVRRGLAFSIVVGTILILINHGDALLRGELTPTRLLKMGLTVVVPLVVSVYSSVAATLEHARAAAAVTPAADAPQP